MTMKFVNTIFYDVLRIESAQAEFSHIITLEMKIS
jgi:hypothetical protein